MMIIIIIIQLISLFLLLVLPEVDWTLKPSFFSSSSLFRILFLLFLLFLLLLPLPPPASFSLFVAADFLVAAGLPATAQKSTETSLTHGCQYETRAPSEGTAAKLRR